MKVVDVMQRNVVTVTEGDALALARQLMLWRGVRHLPVVRTGRVVGMLSERDLLSWIGPEGVQHAIEGTVEDAMKRPVETIEPWAPLADAAATMSVKKLGCLPVVNEGELVGIITNTDLLGSMAQYPLPEAGPDTLDAGAIMTTDLQAALSDDPLLDAAARMFQHGSRHLPVMDGMQRVVGMLSDRDIREAIGNPLLALEDKTRSARIASLRVSDAMTREPRTFSIDSPLSLLVGALVEENFGAVPVVDEEGRLLGIVSYIDLLKVLQRQLAAR
ncbi:MAG: CBS domain-containing protein [Myxococcales bacterium]|nr:CBS domain-containing protein [Myxococcales bacterium]MDH3843342.1 CBS domain-containing protein [Myxococcales bacterium]